MRRWPPGWLQVSPRDPATIVLHVGDHGPLKGWVITHENLLFVVRTRSWPTTQPVVTEPGARARFCSCRWPMCSGRGAGVLRRWWDESGPLSESETARGRHDHSAAHLPWSGSPNLRENLQRLAAEGLRGRQGKIFERAAKVAIDYGRASSGGRSSWWLRAQHALFDRLVYSKLRTAMGGSLQYAITGGANLGERLGFFYAGIGLTVMEGYGLTGPPRPGLSTAQTIRIGSVGQPMPGTAVRIADDGEIWLRGPHVMAGYHNNATGRPPR